MMAIKKNIFITALLAVGFNAYSQGRIMEYLDPNFQNSSLLYSKRPLTETPFLILEFSPGEVTLRSKSKTVQNVEIQYDIEKQHVLIRMGEEMGILDNKLVESFKMTLPGQKSPTVYVAKSFNGGIAYFEVLSDGDIKALKKSDKKKRSTEQATSTGYNDGAKQSEFIKTESYYLFLSADQLVPIKISKKSILAALNNPKYEECGKTLNLKLNSVPDLITLLNDCK
ncbi:hypothetical protein BH09BAC3_BH09BAC3_31080 [soil metagenome]